MTHGVQWVMAMFILERRAVPTWTTGVGLVGVVAPLELQQALLIGEADLLTTSSR